MKLLNGDIERPTITRADSRAYSMSSEVRGASRAGEGCLEAPMLPDFGHVVRSFAPCAIVLSCTHSEASRLYTKQPKPRTR